MNRILLASSVAFALASGSALAADMPLKAPMVPPAPVYSWTGCYVDGGWGYGLWNQDQYEFTTATGGLLSTSTRDGGRGWLGRVGGGCDYQLGGAFSNFVIGAFGDYDFMSIKGSLSPAFTMIGGVGTPMSGDEKETGAGYAGVRLGYLVMPNLMTYVDGGWTGTHYDGVTFANITTGADVARNVGSQNYHGWFFGGGDEYALNLPFLPVHGLFWRTEYRYASYRGEDLTIFNTTTGLATTSSLHSEKDVQTITSSLVWRFNWWNPVTARY